MRITSIILISLFLLSACGGVKSVTAPKPITPVGTGIVVDLPAPSVSGEILTQSGK